jgi:uncharacterized metal-binding protein YceD (DUF177 family)
VKVREKYSVDIYKLKQGIHNYEFPVSEELFTSFESSPVESASGKIMLELDKRDALIEATLDFDVELPLVCDRSLREFSYPVKEAHVLHFKYGEQEGEVDEDVYIITKDTQRLDFSQFIYEFIVLGIPMKRIHPDLQGEESLTYRTDTEDNSGEEKTDPRWDALKKLKKGE